MAPLADYYELLNLPQDATPEEIRRAYHEAARHLHPDVNKQEGAIELFIKVQKAYDVLVDAKMRLEYDSQLAAQNPLPVDCKVTYSRSGIHHVEEAQLVYVLLELSAKDQELATGRPPVNVCLVIDRSTSMQGERMDTVKAAAIEMVRYLKPQDTLSIVAFSDRADVLASAGRQNDRNAIETQIRMLRPGGGTEIFQGLQAGYYEIQRYINRSPINHIILLTDGRTYGDEQACLNLANKAALEGIRITGLGIGTDWNDAFLDEVAAKTGGNTSYIARVRHLEAYLKEKFDSFTQAFAEQAQINLVCSPSVILSSAFRLEPESSILPTSQPIRLGSLPREGKLSLLLEFTLQNLPDNSLRVPLASADISMILIEKANSRFVIPLSLSRLIQDEPTIELPPPPIYQALSRINLYKMQERAHSEVSEGKVQEASQRLQRLATQLISMGERDLAQTALMEAERIQQTHVFSAEGEKKIKYGTRSLFLPASIERETR